MKLFPSLKDGLFLNTTFFQGTPNPNNKPQGSPYLFYNSRNTDTVNLAPKI